MERNVSKRVYITEKELLEIFQEQYNDIFSEILNLTQTNFVAKLKNQVVAFLQITKKYSPPILEKKVEEIFLKKYLEEKEKISKDLELIKNSPKEELEYLDKLNCIIHCLKCRDALHSCGYKFILFRDYVYCLYCNKVYNEHQVYMYCDECDVEYYTKLREIIDYNLENFFLVSISDYHCRIDNEEKIKCPKCYNDLYVDIVNSKNYDKIEEIICIYCNLTFNINLFNYKCKKCGKNFKSDAKIYNDFYNLKNDFICKIHTLCNKNYAFPENLLNKDCDCNINYIKNYKHIDGGILLEGEKNGQKIILCEKCYQIFDYYDYIFSCPLCNRIFKSNYSPNQNIINDYDNIIDEKELEKNNKYFLSLENNINDKNESDLFKEPNTYINKDEFFLSNKNKKTKTLINNPFITKNQLSKGSNSKNKNISTHNKNVTSFSEKENINNKKFKHMHKNYTQNQNQNPNINIKIQNFFNNYVPIIHIIGNNSKSIDKNNDSKYIINRNYTLIRSSPKDNKLNTNMDENSHYISNPAFLKKSITQASKYNFELRNSSAFCKRNKNALNEEKLKDSNFNFSNNFWEQKKKFSASFTINSPNPNNITFPENQLNNKNNNSDSSNKNKGHKKRLSAENNIIRNKVKHKNKHFEKSNLSNIVIKKKKMTKVHTINEMKEEYSNEKEITYKKPKFIKIEKINKNPTPKKYQQYKSNNQTIKKIIDQSSLSEEKHKKIELKQEKSKKDNMNKKIKKLKSDLNNIKITSNNPINKKDTYLNSLENKPKRQKLLIQKMKTGKNEIKPKEKKIIQDFNSEDYNILNIIGEGTFSQIFLVENGENHKKYALKKMTANKMEDLEEKKKEFEFIKQLTSEDEKLNLVKIFGIQIKKLDKFNMVLYVLMEAAKSDWETELKNRHFKKQYYTEEELKTILLNLVQTFSSLQKKGICHRDVKPQNILCFKNGSFKITDFGEAKNKNNKNFENTKFNFSQDTSIQTIRGTELYMSPILFNALRNSSVEDLQYNAFKSDVFSLGLCFLLSASLSYRPLSELRDIKDMDSIKALIEKSLKGRYSKNFNDILYSMLQMEEKDRPDFIELESMIKKTL